MKFFKAALLTAMIATGANAFAYGQVCATVYNSFDPSLRTSLTLQDGDRFDNLGNIGLSSWAYNGNWDNKITQVVVEAGCTFVGYQYQNFNIDYNTGYALNGFVYSLTGHNSCSKSEALNSYYNNKISSAACYCH
jgi:hypothetical protein